MKDAPRSLAGDLARARAAAKRYIAAQKADAAIARRIRRANNSLVAEFVVIIAATYFLIYLAPWPLLLAVMIPWSIASSLVLDNAVHYLNHWPPFRTAAYNIAWRAAGALVFFGILEIRYHHWEHHLDHRTEEPAPDRSAWRYLARELGSSLASWVLPLPPLTAKLRRSRP